MMFSAKLLILLWLPLVMLIFFRRWRNGRRGWLLAGDLLFVTYCFFVAGLLYFPLEFANAGSYRPNIAVNLIPFENAIRNLLSDDIGRARFYLMNLAGNFLMFMPLAGYLAWRMPRRPRRSFWLTALISGGAEILQLLECLLTGTRRSFDIDDILLNLGGGLLAWLAVRCLMFLAKRKRAAASEESKENPSSAEPAA